MSNYLELEDKVVEWAYSRNIIQEGTTIGQAEKTLEEAEELIEGVEDGDKEAIKDAIGDILVTLIIQAQMQNLSVEECLEHAYGIISKRKGKMIGGVFVKQEDLED